MSTITTPKSISATTQASIQVLTNQMTFYGPIILFIIGIISCLCNFITFTAPKLRTSSCAFYFLLCTVFEFFSITFGLISRFAADHLGSTLIHKNRTYCKFRTYLLSALPLIATYMILLSSIDRYLSSTVSVRLRSFSRLKIAHRASVVAITIGFASCAHILFGYDLRPRCGALAGIFTLYESMFVILWLGIIPHVLMLVFGSLTFINIQRTKQSISFKLTTNTTSVKHQLRRREQKTNAQLIMMMLFQVGFSSLLVLTRVIYYAYYVLAPPLTGYNKFIGSFLMSFTTLLYYANYSKSFYIYTLSSHLFRSIFFHRINFCLRKIRIYYLPLMIQSDTSATNQEITRSTHAGRTPPKSYNEYK